MRNIYYVTSRYIKHVNCYYNTIIIFLKNVSLVNGGIQKYYPSLNTNNITDNEMDLIEEDDNYDNYHNYHNYSMEIDFLANPITKFELLLDTDFFEGTLEELGYYNILSNFVKTTSLIIDFIHYNISFTMLSREVIFLNITLT